MSVDESLALGIGLILLVLFLVYVVSYFFGALIRYRILKLFRPCAPIIGFIPLVGQYYVGKCCNGKDGQNTGIFNTRMSNFFWNWGWCSYFACFVIFGVMNYFTEGSVFVTKILVTSAQILSFMYWSSIYAFLYSRIEGRPENEVRVMAIISAVIGVVGFVKVLAIGSAQVYSLPNDIYPLETYDSYSDGGYDAGQQGYPFGYTQDDEDYMQ